MARVPSQIREVQDSIGSTCSMNNYESLLKESSSYGSRGLCKTLDSVSTVELGPQASFNELQTEFAESHKSTEEAVCVICESVVLQDSMGSIRSYESIPETITPPPILPFTPHNEYLKKHLGAPLTHALAEIVIKQPVDPIHYLGHWL
jgi:hypothetical protein